MAKRLFLLLILSLLGVINASVFLTATDTVELAGLDEAKIVETAPLPEPEPSAKVVVPVAYGATNSGSPASVVNETANSVAPTFDVVVAPGNTIAIAGRILEVVDVADTTIDSGGHVNKYGDKFLYGHNSTEVFGGLVNLGVGNIFTVSYGGVSRNYQVAKIVIFEKDLATGKLQLDGAGNYMRSIINARSGNIWYDLSLMTCYGTSYGNGDASHRLVIFANAI